MNSKKKRKWVLSPNLETAKFGEVLHISGDLTQQIVGEHQDVQARKEKGTLCVRAGGVGVKLPRVSRNLQASNSEKELFTCYVMDKK